MLRQVLEAERWCTVTTELATKGGDTLTSLHAWLDGTATTPLAYPIATLAYL